MILSLAVLSLVSAAQASPGDPKPPSTRSRICESFLSTVRSLRRNKMKQPEIPPTLSWRDVAEKLDLEPPPLEGGYYRETYRSTGNLPTEDGKETRSVSTAIYYYMITGSNFSAFHRIRYDEIFHFYDGKSVEVSIIHPDGRIQKVMLGRKFAAGERPQVVIPAGTWQALRIKGASSEDWSLLGTTVAPGFDFRDFELAPQNDLLDQFSEHAELIKELTRSP